MALRCSSPPIILTGVPRSGTTLLADLLGRLGLFIGEKKVEDLEARYFWSVNRAILKRLHGDWDNPTPMQYLLRNPTAIEETAHALEADLRSYRIIGFLGWKRYIRYGSLERYEQPWGWKDPKTVLSLPLWLTVFPDAKVVYIVRNGVDVASSLRIMAIKTMGRQQARSCRAINRLRLRSSLDRSEWKGAVRCLDLDGGFSLWEDYAALVEASLALLDDRKLIIRYEDLLADPKRHLLELRRFCGLDEKMDDRVEDLVPLVNGKRAYAFLAQPELSALYNKIRHSRWMERYGYTTVAPLL